MSDIADRLRRVYERGDRIWDRTLLLDAATEIERLERQRAEAEEWQRENFPEMYR